MSLDRKKPHGRLAIDGGAPVRSTMLPYGQQTIEAEDEAAVLAVLRSGWLTTGPEVERFERAFAGRVGARHAVAVANGTAALHAALATADVGPGDEVLVPSLTFAASANAAVYLGAVPIFVDVDPDTFLIDPASVEMRLTPRTRAIVAVDFAGQPADYASLSEVLTHAQSDNRVTVVADAAHALGAACCGHPVGALADLTTFSLHPVKQITSGEGGVVTTEDVAKAQRLRQFRNHGISRDFRARAAEATWEYDMTELGYNYRLSDIQCGLARAQLRRLDEWLVRRQQIAERYDSAFSKVAEVRPLVTRPRVVHAHHLYVVRLDTAAIGADRDSIFRALRAENIGVNVHYRPVHLHSFYRRRFGTGEGDCPIAEAAYDEILTLPLFHGMTDKDVEDVITGVQKVIGALSPGAMPR